MPMAIPRGRAFPRSLSSGAPSMTEFHLAECGIRQLHARYGDAVWRQDLDAFGDCFTDDGEWRISGRAFRGRTQIKAFMGTVFPLFRRILLTLRTPMLTVGDGTASARTYITEQSVRLDGQPLLAIGTYFEHFVEQGGQWRFSWRLFQAEYAGASDMTGAVYDNPDWGAPPAMPPLDTIPVDHTGLI